MSNLEELSNSSLESNEQDRKNDELEYWGPIDSINQKIDALTTDSSQEEKESLYNQLWEFADTIVDGTEKDYGDFSVYARYAPRISAGLKKLSEYLPEKKEKIEFILGLEAFYSHLY